VELQYLVLHRTQRGASWASGAAQTAQLVMIILAASVGEGHDGGFCFVFAAQILNKTGFR
jgi:hypothetical protein